MSRTTGGKHVATGTDERAVARGSHALLDRVREKLRQGRDPVELAAELGVTPQELAWALRRNTLRGKDTGRERSDVDIADEMGVSKQRVWQLAERAMRKIREDEV